MDIIKDNIKRVLITDKEKQHIEKLYEQFDSNAVGNTMGNYYNRDNPTYVNRQMNNRYIQYSKNPQKTPMDLASQFNKLSEKDTNDLIAIFKKNDPNFQKTLNDANVALKGNPYGNVINRIASIAYPTTKANDLASDISFLNQPKNDIKIPLEPNKPAATEKNKQTPASVTPNYIRDAEVKQLQNFLIQYSGAKIKADGVLGQNTWTAIKNAGLVDVMLKAIRNNANPELDKMASMPAGPIKTTGATNKTGLINK